MATHNIEDGTGGLDASIQFELDRDENVGDNAFNTITHFQFAINRYATLSDLIALAAAGAMEQCGGPKVPFRGGRVDATLANTPGVPEPQQDLNSHIASFARQGFTQSEMIALVACGHTFGGVQHSAFPNIVLPPPEGIDDVSQTFDNTPFTFDNRVAVEYIHGTTNNPLVVGHNDTTNSDKRIFESDNNATMNSFASDPELFKAACGTLFARMIDTVPKGVQLSEVIEPLPAKPTSILLKYMGDGTLQLSGFVRFWNMTQDRAPTINLRWADRAGKTSDAYSSTMGHNANMVAHAKNDGEFSSLWYATGPLTTNYTVVDESAGISKFWFDIIDESARSARVEDQDGAGFALSDTIMVANSTCLDAAAAIAHLDIAVRTDARPSRIYVESEKLNGTVANVLTMDAMPPSPLARRDAISDSDSAVYAIWTVLLPFASFQQSTIRTVDIVAEFEDGARLETPGFTLNGFGQC